jgi:hypothetical protein
LGPGHRNSRLRRTLAGSAAAALRGDCC